MVAVAVTWATGQAELLRISNVHYSHRAFDHGNQIFRRLHSYFLVIKARINRFHYSNQYMFSALYDNDNFENVSDFYQ